MSGTYLYAIMAGEQKIDLGRLGLPDGHARVTTLPASGLGAVISDYRGRAFGELPQAELLRGLAIHQTVIERAMADHAVLPVKFGTTLASDEEVYAVLDRWSSQLANSLTELEDAVEIEAAATWDLRQTFADISRQPEIAALASSIAGYQAEDTKLTRILIGQMVKEALDSRREEYRQRVVHDLRPLVRAAHPNPLLSDEMVLNLAFLVNRFRLHEFYEGVHRLDEALAGQLAFRCIGPLPPYSFATVEIARQNPDEVDAARRLLELGEGACETEIKASFRRLSARWHPDHNPVNPLAAERFAAVTTAYATLLAYGQAQFAPGIHAPVNPQYDFSRPTVEKTILLTIKRTAFQPDTRREESRELNAVV